MKRWSNILLSALLGISTLFALSSCDVHEFPELPEKATLHLVLDYSTDMPQWEYPITDTRTVVPTKSVQTSGEMRYIIRLYPISDARTRVSEPSHEFVFTRNLAEGYDAEFWLDVPAGDYNIMVWSDISEKEGFDPKFYDTSDFSQIMLVGTHEGNNDYRDAFRGTQSISITTDIVEKEPMTTVVNMERPLAKYEFVTTDVNEFIDKEVKAAVSRGEIAETEESPTKAIILEDYKVKYIYAGFMPNTYNMFTDKPSDSAMGVMFDGRFMMLGNGEASLGFDYVFVNGKESTVTLQIAIYSPEGVLISVTPAINVPLRRSQHTLMKGSFLMHDADEGVAIDPSFDGEFNIMI